MMLNSILLQAAAANPIMQFLPIVLIIVVFSKNTLLQVASTLLEVFIIDDLTNVPNPFEEKLHVVTICGLNNLTLSTELINGDASVMFELP